MKKIYSDPTGTQRQLLLRSFVVTDSPILCRRYKKWVRVAGGLIPQLLLKPLCLVLLREWEAEGSGAFGRLCFFPWDARYAGASWPWTGLQDSISTGLELAGRISPWASQMMHSTSLLDGRT